MKTKELLRTILNAFESNDELSLQMEQQNSDYEGATFLLQGRIYRSRLAKCTPKKKGYFVAVWEKDETGTNQAFNYDNAPYMLVIFVIDSEKLGLFAFPNTVLLTKGILKSTTQKGKMAFRVYPNWVTDLNVTAKKTQNWQRDYFLDITNGFEIEQLKIMFCN